jgi:hypothetical protein
MTDMTKAIFSVGWIAPYYNEEGWRDAKCDLFVKISEDKYLPIVLRDEAACLESEMPIDQAKALIDALQRAVAGLRGTPMTPAPKWEPPAELWALLRDDIVAIARNDGWVGATENPTPIKVNGATGWIFSGITYDLHAINLPDIPAEESLFRRPWREGKCDV